METLQGHQQFEATAEKLAYLEAHAIGNNAATFVTNAVLSTEYTHAQEISRYDEKTGALKEKAFFEEVERVLAESPNAVFGLFYIDLGNFKKTNVRSHKDGDIVLTRAGVAFRRNSDIVGRAGDKADELYVLTRLNRDEDRLKHPQDVLAEQAAYFADCRQDLVEGFPFMDEVGKARIYVAAGPVVYDRKLSLAQNLQIAEINMDIAKAEGRSQYGQYRSENG